MNLREEVRTWLVDAKVGLIDADEIVARADRAIAGQESPPDYLLALSMGEPLYHVERLDLVKEPVDKTDLGKLAGRLLALLETNDIDLDRLGVVAANVSFPRADSAAVNVWTHFDWITDELHLIEIGIKDPTKLRAGAVEALRAAAKHADEEN